MKIGWGHLGGPGEYSEGKGGESAVAIPMFLCGSPSLCRLRTEGLVPVSKYWTYRSHASDMCLVSLVACHQQVLDLSTLLQWLCWKRNWGRSHEPLSRAERWSWEHFFSGALHPSNPVDDSWKVATYGDRLQEDYVEWCGKHMCHVGWIFSCWVYIDSNRHDSRIWVTACSWLPSSSNLLD
jgi:hypothetical protein